MPSVLIIEDDLYALRGLPDLLRRHKLHLDCVGTLQEGIDAYQASSHELVLLDLGLPNARIVARSGRNDRLASWRYFRSLCPEPALWVVTPLFLGSAALDEIRDFGDRVVDKHQMNLEQLCSDVLSTVNRQQRTLRTHNEEATIEEAVKPVLLKLKKALTAMEMSYAERH